MTDRTLLRVRLPALVVALALLAAALPAAWSQGDDAESETPTASTLYETATVRARPLETASGSVTVLDREAIDALDVVSVAELIRFVPGLDVVSNGPRGGLAIAQIRGGDPNFTTVLLDGIPLNDTTDQFGGIVNLNSLPTAHVERIEVVRGPLSSFFGSSGLAGAINIITRRGEKSEPAHGFALAAGENSVLQVSASLSDGGDQHDYFVGVSWEQERDRIADDEFEQLAVQGNVGVELGDRTSLRLTGRVTTWEGQDYPDASGGPLFGSGETRLSDHDELSLGLELNLGSGDRRQKIYTAVYRHELDRQSPQIVSPDPFGPFVPRSEESTSYTHGQLGWAYPVTVGRLTLDLGAEVDWESGDNDSTLFLPPAFGGPIDGSYELDRTTAAAFVELIVQRGRALFELGARVDAPEDFDAELSPRAGVSYRLPGERTRLHASAGRAFKLPSFFVLGSPPALGGNPDLEPETTVGADLGVEHAFESIGLSATLAVFYIEFTDLIDFDFASFSLVNRSEVESRGAELSVGWKPAERIALQANLTRQEVEDRQTGDPLRHRPDWIAGLRSSWRCTKKLHWELDGQWVSESVDAQIPVPARDTTAGYQLFGTAVSYQLSDRFKLHARVDNLTDKEYETLIGFPGPDRSFRFGLRHRSR